ncbi:hypothetical protein BDW75DRAFT_246514, partial [Aspergillus navahoensis]
MTARQQRCWQRLWGLAQQQADKHACAERNDAAAPEESAWQMTVIEKACLEFCIELLNQRSIHRTDGGPLPLMPRAGRKPFQDCVEWMVRRFMVRGTHGPMQTLLDWRTYGLKIHYNTTAPGHVTWMGQEQLLYQQVQFTMSKFRGFVHGLVGATRTMLGEMLA